MIPIFGQDGGNIIVEYDMENDEVVIKYFDGDYQEWFEEGIPGLDFRKALLGWG